ncbi:hypothetical protein MSG28_010038 [Choristoneura fumiferana]|uniref:Uncharacterized protein n=1 Tax=Choristoneura fumiferana TaxID=7141 RepID=A0ACC0KJ28_CHOFU|nr:hypothetical protein MSG28_010038 [Choristoneura fumiferana]
MAGKSVSFTAHCAIWSSIIAGLYPITTIGQDLCDSHLEALAKWLSCNGETWGVGPTAVFASAAAVFLYNELEATVFAPGDHAHVSLLEKTLVSSMVVGMLALMVHIWVCSMRFFQYYLDTLIKDSPNVLLEMTTAGLLGGGQTDLVALGPLTRFLKQQQPQIHITLCWFLSLCYADYVRKHYCTRFNMPYLEQWLTDACRSPRHPDKAKLDVHQHLQLYLVPPRCRWALMALNGLSWRARQAELHERAGAHVRSTMARVHSFVGGVQRRLRGFATPATTEAHTGTTTNKQSFAEVSGTVSRVSWADGCGGGSGTALSPEKEMCVRLVGQSSETAADAIEKLRAYIKATRCSCTGGHPETGLCSIGHLTPQEGDK